MNCNIPLALVVTLTNVLAARALEVNAVVPARVAATAMETVRLHVAPTPNVTLARPFPVRTGVPFARGILRAAEHVRLKNPAGVEVPCQVKVLSVWDAGESIRFLLVSFQAEPGVEGPYVLEYGTTCGRGSANGVVTADDGQTVTMSNGVLTLTIARNSGDIISTASDANRGAGSASLLAGPVKGRLVTRGATDELYETGDLGGRSVTIEESGPLAAVVRVAGWYKNVATAKGLCQYVTRIYLYKDRDEVRLVHTFINTVPDDGAFRELSLRIPLPVGDNAAADFHATPETPGAAPLHVSLEDIAKAGSVQTATNAGSVLGFAKGKPAVLQTAEHVGNAVTLTSSAGSATVAMRWMWQQHPSGIAVDRNGLVDVHFWSPLQPKVLALEPKEYLENLKAEAHDVYLAQSAKSVFAYQRFPDAAVNPGTLNPTGEGLGKTHELTVLFHTSPAASAEAPLMGLMTEHPAYAFPAPGHVTAANVYFGLAAQDPTRFPQVEKLVSAFIQGYYDKQQQQTGPFGDLFGFFAFGDTWHESGSSFHRIYAHHFYAGPAAPWVLYYRSGDRKAREWAQMNTRHVSELDTGHYTRISGAGANEEIQTLAGGVQYEDSSPFHWYSCNPGKGYTASIPNTSNIAEYLAKCHEMTGDERAREVMLEVQSAMQLTWRRAGEKLGWSHRASGYALKNVLAIWEVTGDATLKKIADFLAAQIRSSDPAINREGLHTGYDGNTPGDFTLAYVFPAMIDYLRSTGDAAVAEWIVTNAQFCGRTHKFGKPDYFAAWDGLVCASMLTGDPAWADLAWFEVQKWTEQFVPAGNTQKSWSLYKVPQVMTAMQARPELPSAKNESYVTSTEEILIEDRGDGPLSVSLMVFGPLRTPEYEAIAAFTPENRPQLLLLAPDGKVCATRPYPAAASKPTSWFAKGAWSETFQLGGDGQRGVYRIQLLHMPPATTPASAPMLLDGVNAYRIPALMHAYTNPAAPLMGKLPSDGMPPLGRNKGGRVYFYVPRRCAQVKIEVQANVLRGTHPQRGPLQLWDADGVAPVAPVAMPPQADYLMNWFTIQAVPTAPQQGTAWSVFLNPDLSEVYRVKFSGVAPYYALKPGEVISIEPDESQALRVE